MIELYEKDKKELNRKSSKGNQLKFERDGIWYKADYTGYEGLAEYVVSHLLMKSSLDASEYVTYDQEEIIYKKQVYMGVSSKDFLKDGEQLITLERLFTNIYGIGLNSMIYKTREHEDRLKIIVTKTEDLTGLRNFGVYMAKMMAIDAFFLNEDRHTHNIAVIMCSDGSYRYCPFFDHGAGLLADTKMDYPITSDMYELIDSVESKTFCQDFDEQLDIAEKTYGSHLRFTFSKNDVNAILENAYGYEQAEIDRVRNIVFEQMRKYRYMFKQ